MYLICVNFTVKRVAVLRFLFVFFSMTYSIIRTKFDGGFYVRPLNLSNPACRVGCEFGIVPPVTSFSVLSYLFRSQTCESDVCQRVKA